LEQLRSQAVLLTQKLLGLDESQSTSLQKKISQYLTQINAIDLSLVEQVTELKAELPNLLAQIKEIEESDNFLALQENVSRANAEYEACVETCADLKSGIERLVTERATLNSDLSEYQPELEKKQRQLAQFDKIEWQSGYQEFRMGLVLENGDVSIALYRKLMDLESQLKDARLKLEKAVQSYMGEYSPGLSARSFESQCQACLEDRGRLQELELEKLQTEQKRYRFEAENILKTTFLDALLKEHKLIRSNINELNKAIQHVKLGSRSYRFNAENVNTSEVKEVCAMLEAYEALKPEQRMFDFTDQIFDSHRDLIARLFKLFEESEDNLAQEAYHKRKTLLTPTKYFKFDLQARQDDDAKWFSLTRHYEKGSGGEHQNPLYILLAGTMLQLYANNPERPRLVLIDEAFGKAPFSAGPGLKLLIDEGLQPIVSTVLNQPQVEEVVGYTAHISRPNVGDGKYKKLVYVITDQKESLQRI
jgi:hypothetical protein